jgi:hypothetical protein
MPGDNTGGNPFTQVEGGRRPLRDAIAVVVLRPAIEAGDIRATGVRRQPVP